MLTDTLQLIKKYNIKLDKRKGQNYLINRNILFKILDAAQLSNDDIILEIGPGIGTLTIPMAQQAGKIIAIEQDGKIADVLTQRLKDKSIDNVEVITADATKIDLPDFNKAVSNLPYQISSPITFKLLNKNFDYAILMYQYEFARRMTAKPGDSNYSRLSLMLKYCAQVEMLFKVQPDDFHPQPKVSSAVIKLKTTNNVKVSQSLKNVSRALFQHKNKKTRNALLDSFHEIADLDKSKVKEIINKLDPNLLNERVVKLNPDDVIILSKQIEKVMEINK